MSSVGAGLFTNAISSTAGIREISFSHCCSKSSIDQSFCGSFIRNRPNI